MSQSAAGSSPLASAVRVDAEGPCPSCGKPVRVASLSTRASCGACRAALAVVPPSGGEAVALPDAIGDPEDGLRALLADEGRRRKLAAGLRAAPLDPMDLDLVGEELTRLLRNGAEALLPSPVSPVSDLPERLASAAVDRDLRRLRGLRVVHHEAFVAPYWHFVTRLYESVAGTTRGGRKVLRAAARLVPVATRAVRAAVPLPASAHLSAPLPVVPITALATRPRRILPAVRASVRLESLARRLASVRLVRDVVPLAREGRLWESSRALVLRPLHLLVVARERARDALLLDGASRSVAGVLTGEETDRLLSALVPFDPAGHSLAPGLVLLACPGCGASLGRGPDAPVLFCATCGAASRLGESALLLIPHRVSASAREPLPFWRFRFDLDGAASLAAIRARLLAPRRPLARRDAGFLDVPAFLRDREGRTTRTLPSPRPAADSARELLPGPLPPAGRFLRPSRPVNRDEDEAAFAARQTLLSLLDPAEVDAAPPARVRDLLFEAPLSVEGEGLVLLDQPCSVPIRSRRPDPLSRR